ncbi:unnamed protein product [Mytilus coruscus]|uniref:Uncharacterized protein n=1 Tax=Mytilus coruscus TaxID=42192 RepID=A0A6J8ALQ0_MYTCO|nr:unnamed protein product [Mytilus coruscus]
MNDVNHYSNTESEASTQTTNIDSSLINSFIDACDALKKINRYEDFVSVLKGIGGFKAEGLAQEYVTPTDCRINFAVPSNPILTKESAKFSTDADKPGLLNVSLDAFATVNVKEDVKISIDGKKIALGLGTMGDENLDGFEVCPTLKERKDRLDKEVENIREIMNVVETSIDTEISSLSTDINSNILQQGLIITITNTSKRIQQLRELTVKWKLHVKKLIKSVEGDWRQSKLANAISYWHTKLLQARNCITELLQVIDNLGFAIACLNGTSGNYVPGNQSTVFLDKQSNYICLKDIENATDISDGIDTNTIKQRSNEWQRLRKESRITGSTIFRAVGLNTLKDQQEHYDRVFRLIEKPVSEELSSMFEYGTTNEKHALG